LARPWPDAIILLVSLTSRSLLDRLKNAAPDAPEWRRLHTIYLPLIQYWLRRVPGVSDEADDLAQDVLIVLVRELPAFERRRDGSFRTWLRGITLNRIRAFQRTRRKQPIVGGEDDALLSQLADSTSDLARQWDLLVVIMKSLFSCGAILSISLIRVDGLLLRPCTSRFGRNEVIEIVFGLGSPRQ
jgi:Sigma-70 region 2